MDNWTWTDELVLEFVRYTKEDAPTFQGRYADLKLFKQSKQNSNKDWEIVSYAHDKRYLHSSMGECGCPIKSVRRISDNEVFSVGDGCSGFGYEEISHFTIAGKEMIASFKSGIFSNIDFLFKKAKQKLFTTEDLKDIYEGDEYWYVEVKENSSPLPQKYNATDGGFYGGSYAKKTFSTEAAAKNHIFINKPCLSIMDLTREFDVLNDVKYYDDLEKLVEKKINNGERQ